AASDGVLVRPGPAPGPGRRLLRRLGPWDPERDGDRCAGAGDGEEHGLRGDRVLERSDEHGAHLRRPGRGIGQEPGDHGLVREGLEAQRRHLLAIGGHGEAGGGGRCGHGCSLDGAGCWCPDSPDAAAPLQWFRHTEFATKGLGMTCAECGRSWSAPQRTGRPRRYCSRSCQARAYRRRRDRGRLSAAGRPSSGGRESAAMLEGAIALADAEGLEAVSLRAVAERAGLSLTAAQREAGSRAEPVALLRGVAESAWSSYRAHPWLVDGLASTRPPLVPAVLDASRAAVEAFVALCLDTDAALTRYLAFSGYLQGMALLLATEERE